MSAFFVEYAVIDDVTSHLTNNSGTVATALGKALLEMNLEALTQRYNLSHASEEYSDYLKAIENYIYQKPDSDAAQIAKSFGCLQYQCYEGKVGEWPLLKIIAGTGGRLQQRVSDELYDAAIWDRVRGGS